MKNMMVMCLTAVLLVVLCCQQGEGARFCGRPLSDFLARTCSAGGKLRLKGNWKLKMVIIRMTANLDMSREDRNALLRMLSRKSKPRGKRSSHHVPSRLVEELESAESVIEATESNENVNLFKTFLSKLEKESFESHGTRWLSSSRGKRSANRWNIVDACCHNDCDIDEVRTRYCKASG